MMLDAASVGPISNGVNRNLVTPRLTGWVDNSVDVHRLRYMCLKPGATPRRSAGS